MPKPHIFASEEELVAELQNKKTLEKAREFFSESADNVFDVVRTGVTGNTFRAFRKLSLRPSVTFRDWAVTHLQDTLDEVLALNDEAKYADYVHRAALGLCIHWRQITTNEMGYGRGAKLFNLVLKKLACLTLLSQKQRDTLIQLQHVPLDSYTIMGLQKACPELAIPNGSTMKYIEGPEQYQLFQRKIAELTARAGVPPIYYDILAWNMRH